VYLLPSFNHPTRLGHFLFTRINAEGGIDTRFTEIKPNLIRFLTAWSLQGLWVFTVSLPVYIALSIKDTKPLGLQDYVGIAVWVIGFGFEVVADSQKNYWREHTKKTSSTPFINTGLWSISRHPNYFGEISLWIGVLICAASTFTSVGHACALASPLLTATLLIKVSGIPMLEKAADKKWSDNHEYKAYKANVPVLIPFVGRKGDAAF
jgi:steroid 5-alpha reductase family enzyme